MSRYDSDLLLRLCPALFLLGIGSMLRIRIQCPPQWIVYKDLIFNLVDFFFVPKMHQPRFYTLLRVFFILHISHTSYPTFSHCLQYNTTIFISTRHSVRHYSGYFVWRKIIILLVGNNLPISNLMVENCYPLKLLPILQQRSKFM